MRFSTASGIVQGEADDWFDPVLEQDSPLYIDPYLVFGDGAPEWAGAYDDVVSFFETALSLVLASGGNEDTAAWRKAIDLLHFPEPHEFALGLALGSPRGAGTGDKYARDIAKVLALVGESNVPRLAGIGGFSLFCEGLGVDRVSDILANILKSRFISYTQSTLARHGVVTAPCTVEHPSWSSGRGRWASNADLDLLPNPWTGGGVLLVPDRFLKDIPRIEPHRFWDWAALGEGAKLRDDLSFDLSESLTNSAKVRLARRLAWRDPDLALTYVEQMEAVDRDPYDTGADPRGLVHWYEDGETLLARRDDLSGSFAAPGSDADFNDWVLGLAKEFKHVIENTDAWTVLWEQGQTKHRPEKIAQAVASVLWRGMCRAADVTLGKEVNIGRGPVDFSFAQGWARKALVELKYIESSHFNHGVEKQLPQYMISEGTSFGVYIAIGFKDDDFAPKRHQRVTETRDAVAEQLGYQIEIVWVDARPKPSASTI